MADVSKLRLGNTSYNVKDADARRYLVMVNDDPEPATKVVVTSGSGEVELALQEDLDALQEDQGDLQEDLNALQEDIEALELSTDWFVTPEMYGAVGDGVTNDATAIQAALNSGKTVVLTHGATYEIGSTLLLVQHDGLTIHGNGAIIQNHNQTANVSAEMIRINDHTDVRIHDVILYGFLTSVGSSRKENNHGITLNNSENILIDGCIFKDIEGDAICIGATSQVNGVQISNCTFEKAGTCSIYIVDGKKICISNNVFIGNTTNCVNIQEYNVNHKTEVSILNNASFGCAKLINVIYSHSVTNVNIIVDGWASHNDSISNGNASLNSSSATGGLFSIRLFGGATPTGCWAIKNIAFNGCTGILFWEIMASKVFTVNLSDITVVGCSGSYAFYSYSAADFVTFTRQISVAWDASNNYTNFANLEHSEDVTTGGGITYNVYADGYIPSSLLGNAQDFVLDANHWTFFSSQQGTGNNPLPLKWEEVLVECLFGSNTDVAITFHIIKPMETRKLIGGCGKTDDNHQLILKYNKPNNNVAIQTWYWRDTNVASTSYVRIYYR